MQKMSPIPTFSIALDIRAGRIPVRWTIRDHTLVEERGKDGRIIRKGGIERVLWPQVKTDKWGEATPEEIDDTVSLRAELFRALKGKWSDDFAVILLNKVGAWRIVEDDSPEEWEKKMYPGAFARVAYRHRYACSLMVLPITVDELKREIEYWYSLVGHTAGSSTQKKAFGAVPLAGSRPADRHAFAIEAHFANTLPVSIEWCGAYPRAVIETLSATEMLMASAWAGVVARSAVQVCARCHTRFDSPRKRKYCTDDCGHLVAVLKYKRKIAAAKRESSGVL